MRIDVLTGTFCLPKIEFLKKLHHVSHGFLNMNLYKGNPRCVHRFGGRCSDWKILFAQNRVLKLHHVSHRFLNMNLILRETRCVDLKIDFRSGTFCLPKVEF